MAACLKSYSADEVCILTNDCCRVLVTYRLQQASETADVAEFLVKSEKLKTAVNRIYYAIYYCLTALALKYSYETSKHSQLIGWFNKEFISKGIVDKRFGKIVKNAFQNRTKGDYDAYVSFSVPEVKVLLDEMNLFIKEISGIIESE
ncbi:MAG: HEPN domain-containing protein [Planctomycetota bacterium]